MPNVTLGPDFRTPFRDFTSNVSGNNAAALGRTLGIAAPSILPQGLSTLSARLGRQGRTDPALFQLQLSDIGRQTGINRDRAAEGLSRAGNLNSGFGQALLAAIDRSGAAQRNRAIASENFLAGEREAQDLALLNSLFLQPLIQLRGLDVGLEMQRAAQPSTSDRLLSAAAGVGGSLLTGGL